MSTFTARPPISSHVRIRTNIARCSNPDRINVQCAVCGPIDAVSFRADFNTAADEAMKLHVKLVLDLAHLPDTPTVCLTLCRRHTRMKLVDAVRTGWESGDPERLIRAWDRFEDEYGQDAPEIAGEDFGSDGQALQAALDKARRDLPAVLANRALWEAARATDAAKRNREHGMGAFTGWSLLDDEPEYPEHQSTMWGSDA